MNEVLKAMETRSSIRKYTDEAISDEDMQALLTAALQAPTAANKQEFHVSVVKNGNAALSELNAELTKDRPGNVSFYYDAPVVMFISGDKNFGWSALDCGIVVENIHLAAHALGLGSLIIGCVKGILTGERESYYAEKFGFPENYGYQIAISIGHCATTKEPHTYDQAAQVTFVD